MSIYFSEKRKKYRYDFKMNGMRYTSGYFKAMNKAIKAEDQRKEELRNPKPIPIDMVFLELENRRLDWLTAYKTEMYFRANNNLFKQLTLRWGHLNCSEITTPMIQEFVLERAELSHETANYYLRLIRALFNFGKKCKFISSDPTEEIEFLPVEKKIKYIPPESDIQKVLFAADGNTRDYIFAIIDTLARVNEIHHLTWDDVNFDKRYIILRTRKKRGSTLTPRQIPMTDRLYQILIKRFENRDKSLPWVFWHRYWSTKLNKEVNGPYTYRGKLMKILCERAKVSYFGYHAFRHFGASVLANNNVPLPHIQKTLGHQKLTTTEGYIQSLGEGEREAIRIFESHTQFHTQMENGASQELEKTG